MTVKLFERSARRMFAIGVTVLAVSCAPIYETVYTFTPPASEHGKICANQCEQIKQSCRQNCRLEKQICLYEAKQEAQEDYDDYVRARREENKEIKKDLNDFYNPYCSENSCQGVCDADHRVCYPSCGGRVESFTRCIAFCD